MENRAVISFHDALACQWEAKYKSPGFGVRLQVISELLSSGLRGQKWLDAGCGTGTISRWLAERGASVLAIDGSDRMLAHASQSESVEYRKADVVKTGLPDSNFDGIVCSSVLEYLPSPELALTEFHRLLKAGGTLVASVPNRAASVRVPMQLVYWLTRPLGKKRCLTYLDHSRHHYNSSQFSRLLRRHGFASERMIEYGELGLPFGLRAAISGILIMALSQKV
jgi:2-polyprenyl-6-hydroxyphenyl methylase/3-demethylubiquinone-9 3-methyltransferase